MLKTAGLTISSPELRFDTTSFTNQNGQFRVQSFQLLVVLLNKTPYTIQNILHSKHITQTKIHQQCNQNAAKLLLLYYKCRVCDKATLWKLQFFWTKMKCWSVVLEGWTRSVGHVTHNQSEVSNKLRNAIAKFTNHNQNHNFYKLVNKYIKSLTKYLASALAGEVWQKRILSPVKFLDNCDLQAICDLVYKC